MCNDFGNNIPYSEYLAAPPVPPPDAAIVIDPPPLVIVILLPAVKVALASVLPDVLPISNRPLV
jgi:hypothetical protein